MHRTHTALTTVVLAVASAVGTAAPVSAAPEPAADVTHEALVSEWYLDFLGRTADLDDDLTATGPARYWVDQLDAGAPHADVLRSITRSREHADRVVEAYYEEHLGRSPAQDPGWRYWVDGIQTGMAPEWVEQNVMASAPSPASYPSPQVDSWYASILGRRGDDPASWWEEVYWTEVIVRDGSSAAARGICYSAEGVDRRTEDLFATVLDREPTAPEHAYFDPRTAASAIETAIELAVTPEYEVHAETRELD